MSALILITDDSDKDRSQTTNCNENNQIYFNVFYVIKGSFDCSNPLTSHGEMLAVKVDREATSSGGTKGGGAGRRHLYRAAISLANVFLLHQ